MRRSVLSFVALTALAAAAGLARAFAAPALETGEIAGAKFAIARPARWNGRLLLLAHGLRAEDRPLVADLYPEHLACKALLDDGWIVAKTSFRRNGLIVADAIADLDALRAHIAARDGRPERVLLEGESMGGLIATLITEREPGEPPLYDGAVAIGAALQLHEPGSSAPGLSLRPKIPLIFLTNQSELDGPKNYLAADLPRPPALRPVLFRVSRDGHVNVNQRERLAALRALNVWLDRGRAALPQPEQDQPFFDATVAPAPQPSRVALHADRRGFDAHVLEISGNYGNVLLDAQPGDFAAVGLEPMARLLATAHGQTFRVVYGRDFTSVKRTEWVVFPNADGFCWLARNFADAAASARLQPGDVVTLRRFDDPKPAAP